MLSKLTDKVLNSETISRILKYPEVSKKYANLKSYYYEIRPGSTLVYIKVKKEYKNKINGIVNDIKTLFANDVKLAYPVTSSETTPKNPFYNNALVLTGGTNRITILFPLLKDKIKTNTPEVLKAGVTNELMIVSIVKDQLQLLNEIKNEVGGLFPYEFKPNLTLQLYEKTNPVIRGKIGPITSISKVGDVRVNGLQQKTDVKVNTTGGPVNISIKQNVFPAWSSAMPYSGAKQVLKYLINNNQIQIQKVSGYNKIQSGNTFYDGIAIPATTGEIKKYCFSDQEIDYIFINTFSSGDIISEITKTSTNNYTVDLKSNLIYRNTSSDIERMKPNVFLSIRSDSGNSSGLIPEYPGFKTEFIPENKIAERNLLKIASLPSISGRL
jgi:hypothetical protein